MISGATRLFAILGDPVLQVRTPELFNALMASRGADAVMVPVQVGSADLAAVVAGLRRMENLSGFIVTVPHKTAMPALCDAVSAAAAAVGAVNAVRRHPNGRLEGAILDGIGFVKGLERAGLSPRGRSVFMAGAGGAARAIAFALAEAGAARLGICNRTAARVQELRERLVRSGHGIEVVDAADPAGWDLVVNATSLGMAAGDPLPLDPSRLSPAQAVAEIIMKPPLTPLLLAARERGCEIVTGAPMLECQIELMADAMGAPR